MKSPEWNKKWGPYLSDRQWGVVREDYSPEGDAWDYTTHDQARSKAWRWGEEGIGGISDEQQLLCFSTAFWNGRDPILKERLYGLSNSQGNHGEDVKELYYYLDNAPDHRYMRMLYKYPQDTFPYEQLVEENSRRSREDGEFEILQTGVFNQNRYFDIVIEYAKGDAEDILIQITAYNRSADDAALTLLPTLWFRDLWSFGLLSEPSKPQLVQEGNRLIIKHIELDTMYWYADDATEFLFCENETNLLRLYDSPNIGASCKDGINDFILSGDRKTLNPEAQGTKAAAFYQTTLPAQDQQVFRLRLTTLDLASPFEDFDAIFSLRKQETDQFYAGLQKDIPDEDLKRIQRQAWAGLLWNKQFYYYYVPRWLDGDIGQPPPPPERLDGRNHDWRHFKAAHILSMPDKWEYPWFAAWDLAFHCIPLARLDPAFAKSQMDILHSDTFRRTDGSIPAYEWNFNDVNPPVQAWAVWRIFEIEKQHLASTQKKPATGDRDFLSRLFEPLRASYDWWFAQKDADGNDLFGGGFLGLDNIGVFDRSQPLPEGERLEQADATAWAAFYSLQMLRIALELAQKPDKSDYYQQQAFDFFQHFLQISFAIGNTEDQRTLWDDKDGFFYDTLRNSHGAFYPLKVRSMVGLLPLLAVLTLDETALSQMPSFKSKADQFLAEHPDLASMVSRWHEVNQEKRLLSLLRGHRMKCLLTKMLDPEEFLSDYGVRSLSKWHLNHPFRMNWLNQNLSVRYLPGESDSGLFGGNSNWRGPIWMPVNFLLLESLREFHRYYGSNFKVECPVGSGQLLDLQEVAQLLSDRLLRLFQRDKDGKRPLHGGVECYAQDTHFRDLLLFYEYFDGDTGRGAGASHQTGWTGLVAELP